MSNVESVAISVCHPTKYSCVKTASLKSHLFTYMYDIPDKADQINKPDPESIFRTPQQNDASISLFLLNFQYYFEFHRSCTVATFFCFIQIMSALSFDDYSVF